MEKLKISIEIKASREKVWDTMLQKETYEEWTKSFCPTSSYKGDWNEGSKIIFVGLDPETGEEGGMVSRIKENRLHEFISIEHLGMIINGVEDYESEMVKKWTPAFENYSFNEIAGGTEILVEQDIESGSKETFMDLWKEALERLKELCEKD